MKIELFLVDRKKPGRDQKVELELSSIPRIGECIIVGNLENYEVTDVIYRLDSELRFTERISVTAQNLWTKE
jgi:hypothetical protein